LLRVTVCSRFPPDPVNLPVFTSTTVIASVRSITRVPPDGSHTFAIQRLGQLLVDAVHANTSGRREDTVSYLVIPRTNSGATDLT